MDVEWPITAEFDQSVRRSQTGESAAKDRDALRNYRAVSHHSWVPRAASPPVWVDVG